MTYFVKCGTEEWYCKWYSVQWVEKPERTPTEGVAERRRGVGKRKSGNAARRALKLRELETASAKGGRHLYGSVPMELEEDRGELLCARCAALWG